MITPSDKLIYIDTCILTKIAAQESRWPAIRKYLIDNNYAFAISEIVLTELVPVQNQNIRKMLISLPSCMIKSMTVIRGEEVAAFPSIRIEPLSTFYFQSLIISSPDINKSFDEIFSSLARVRGDYVKTQSAFKKNVEHLKSSFPKKANGKYERDQSYPFAYCLTLQQLISCYPDFAKTLVVKDPTLDLTVLKSFWLYGLYIFEKYYIRNRDVTKLSDLGDAFHLGAISYCKMFWTENDMADILNQVKSSNNVLQDCTIQNIATLRRQFSLKVD